MEFVLYVIYGICVMLIVNMIQNRHALSREEWKFIQDLRAIDDLEPDTWKD